MKFALLLLVGCISERTARIGATAYVAGITACDVGQTYKESDGGRWDWGPDPDHVVLEQNPFLGPTPSPGLLATNLALTEALTVAIASKAPRWAAWTYLGVVGAVETYIVLEHTKWAGVCG